MIEELLKYQSKEYELIKFKRQMEETDEAKKYLQAKNQLKAIANKMDTLNSRAQEIKKLEESFLNNLKELDKQICEYEKNVESCENEEELNYCKKKFSDKLKEFNNLENQIKSITAEVTTSVEEYKKCLSSNDEMLNQRNENYKKVQTLLADNKNQLNKFNKELEEISKKIDTKLFESYKRKRQDSFPVVVPVKMEKYCSKCNTQLSLASIQTIKNNGFVECEICHRLVYINKK